MKLIGTLGFSHITFAKSLKLISRRKVDVKNLITHKFNLDQVLEAIETSAERKGLKVLLAV